MTQFSLSSQTGAATQPYDFIAIGIGPFNLGLACLTQTLSQVNGLFDELCEQMPYVLESIDLLTKDGFCEVHEGEVICITNSNQIISDFDAFTEAAFQESKSYSDRQFLREVISIV